MAATLLGSRRIPHADDPPPRGLPLYRPGARGALSPRPCPGRGVGGRYDARSAAINVWSHHWLHPAARGELEIVGSFYVHWAPPPRLYAIETDEGFSLGDLMQELGRLERKALGRVKHGHVPPPEDTP
jgi:hypothetical protein